MIQPRRPCTQDFIADLFQHHTHVTVGDRSDSGQILVDRFFVAPSGALYFPIQQRHKLFTFCNRFFVKRIRVHPHPFADKKNSGKKFAEQLSYEGV